MCHQREPFAWQIVAEIRTGPPLTVDLCIRINVVRTVHLARVQIYFVGGTEVFPRTTAPVANKQPIGIVYFFGGFNLGGHRRRLGLGLGCRIGIELGRSLTRNRLASRRWFLWCNIMLRFCGKLLLLLLRLLWFLNVCSSGLRSLGLVFGHLFSLRFSG